MWHLLLFSFQITVQRESGLDVTAPKHGKIDPNNAPHVGGNQWAGGTGNRFLTMYYLQYLQITSVDKMKIKICDDILTHTSL